MNRPATRATILKTRAATFFKPYPSRNPNVPPKPTWLTSKVARPLLSNGSTGNYAHFPPEALMVRHNRSQKDDVR
jgi:hypothetical protein